MGSVMASGICVLSNFLKSMRTGRRRCRKNTLHSINQPPTLDEIDTMIDWAFAPGHRELWNRVSRPVVSPTGGGTTTGLRLSSNL